MSIIWSFIYMLCVAQAEESQSETMNYGNIRPEHYG